LALWYRIYINIASPGVWNGPVTLTYDAATQAWLGSNDEAATVVPNCSYGIGFTGPDNQYSGVLRAYWAVRRSTSKLTSRPCTAFWVQRALYWCCKVVTLPGPPPADTICTAPIDSAGVPAGSPWVATPTWNLLDVSPALSYVPFPPTATSSGFTNKVALTECVTGPNVVYPGTGPVVLATAATTLFYRTSTPQCAGSFIDLSLTGDFIVRVP
jgi:hypothetical protein